MHYHVLFVSKDELPKDGKDYVEAIRQDRGLELDYSLIMGEGKSTDLLPDWRDEEDEAKKQAGFYLDQYCFKDYSTLELEKRRKWLSEDVVDSTEDMDDPYSKGERLVSAGHILMGVVDLEFPVWEMKKRPYGDGWDFEAGIPAGEWNWALVDFHL